MKRTLFGVVLMFVVLIAVAMMGRSEAADVRYTDPRSTDVEQTRQAALQQWGLTQEEYARYKTLMRGVRGAFSDPNISPLEVLGIHAKTPQERRQYAERLVRILYEDTERVIAFEREVQAAWKRLGKPMFEADPITWNDSGVLVPGPRLKAALKGRRLAVFVSTENCPLCAGQVRSLLQADLPGLDIYVTDTDDEGAIRAFAREAGVTPESVAAKKVTLNRGMALFALQEGAKPQLPALYVRIGSRLIALGEGSP